MSRWLPALLAVACASPAAAQVAGPDAFGYAAFEVLYDYVDISSIGVPVVGVSDDAETALQLPFDFPWYGHIYDHVVLSENGAVAFVSGANAIEIGWLNGPLPAFGADTDDIEGAPDIAAFWDDLNVGEGGAVYAAYDGDYGRFIVSWEELPHYFDDGDGSFQLHLYEDGAVQIHWTDTDFGNGYYDLGASATVGIQDRAGGTQATNHVQVHHEQATLAGLTGIEFHTICADDDLDGALVAAWDCPQGTDCDDADATVHPGATEVCADGVDQDCDGWDQLRDMDLDGDPAVVCGGTDCDDLDAARNPATDADGDGIDACGDCDDLDPSALPGGTETCDGVDNDCDGFADDLDDADGDGVTACAGDCDDDDATAFPGATEACDGVDHDCNGVTLDLDADGDGWSACGPDCDDGEPAVHPAAAELCDTTDSDCDGAADGDDLDVGAAVIWSADLEASDGGFVSGAAVGSTPIWAWGVPTSGPGRAFSGTSVWATNPDGPYGLNENTATLTLPLVTLPATPAYFRFAYWQDNESSCRWDFTSLEIDTSGLFMPLADGDGCAEGLEDTVPGWRVMTVDLSAYVGMAVQIRFVHSTDISLPDFPGTYLDELSIRAVDDSDEDGAIACVDCDDADPARTPGAEEICDDGVDQDCVGGPLLSDADGDTEVAIACGGTDCDDGDAAITSATDADGDGVTLCGGDCDDQDPARAPTLVEIDCDGLDGDCDGADGGAPDDLDGDGFSGCTGDCDDGDPTAFPGATEVCDGVDNDCQFGPDGIDGDGDGHQPVACGGGDCDDADPAVHPAAAELCDSTDTDCDGLDDVRDPSVGASVLWSDDFETNDGSVTEAVAAGSSIWSWGPPSFGAQGGYEGPNVWGTNLVGPYAVDDNDAALVLPTVTLPAGDVALHFAYWQDNEGSCQFDYTILEVDAGAGFAPIDDGDGCFGGLEDAPQWTVRTIDLSGFAGGDVTVRFRHVTDSTSSQFAGVYIDAVSFVLPGADADGDGAMDLCGDCDASDATVSPLAGETCDDGVDQDCSGADLPGDVDGDGDLNPACGGSDCDDADAAVGPSQDEVCDDGIDNDCEGDSPDVFDGDGDGVDCALDCDDASAVVFPGFVELCDGLDNDCDAATDGVDRDGDGSACDQDCDDTWPALYPGAVELACSDLDEDCDPVSTPDVIDQDLDGYLCDVDCGDLDPAIHPGATELDCDGYDNDCNAATLGDPDDDGDGSNCAFDCDDDDPARSPDIEEVCGDTIDNDCNPSSRDDGDFDGDGAPCTDDCAEGDPDTYPGAPERCADGVDQDCDGAVDELAADPYALGDNDAVLFSLCSFSFPFCGQDWSEVWVQSNGRLTFGFDDHGDLESASGFVLEAPAIAALWDNLDPAAGGSIEITEVDGDSVEVAWIDVPERSVPGSANNVALTLRPDGSFELAFGGLSAQDGLVGWACGDADVFEVDLSGWTLPAGSTRLGRGTEDAFFELFQPAATPATTNDLAGLTLDFCGSEGTDDDGDGWAADCGDCDDAAADVYPQAVEACDTVDNDCDGVVDEVDADGDGAVDDQCGGDDCDDADATRAPGLTEACNGIDDDCDGDVGDEEVDADGDGATPCEGDCDDGDADVNEDGTEVCDGADNDCDGSVDDGFVPDIDQDGHASEDCGGDDCDDGRANVHPGAAEACEGLDNDCDGVVDDIDADGDGYLAISCDGDDCNDQLADVHPGATEVPYDGLDNDCQGGDVRDVDGDGYEGGPEGADCDDNSAAVYPTAVEACTNEIDDDCDDLIDRDDDGDCRSGCRGSVGGSPLIGLGLLLLRRRRGQR